MTDKVFIEGLEIDTLIGIYDWERRIRQTLVFDIEMAFDNRIPAASDDIALTLNYKDVSKRLIDYVGQSGFGLVETLAERCAEIILGEFNVSMRLKLSKPGAGARAVGVIIERAGPDGARASAFGSNVDAEAHFGVRRVARSASASRVVGGLCVPGGRFRWRRFPQCRGGDRQRPRSVRAQRLAARAGRRAWSRPQRTALWRPHAGHRHRVVRRPAREWPGQL
jgi:dihydroneopterin aldolase